MQILNAIRVIRSQKVLAIAGSTAVALSLILCLAAQPTLGSDSRWPSDPDFLVQGEFQGSLSIDAGSTRLCAFQVVAKGSDQFDAVLYRGGFPGTGWDESDRLRFSGSRQDGVVKLESEETGITATMTDPNSRRWAFTDSEAGRSLGSLRAIRRQSPTLGAIAPAGATVLFRNGEVDGLSGTNIDEDGLLDVGFRSTDPVQDFQLHVEFRTPWEPNESGQGRGNSGVYIQQRYEVQVLDSFGLDGVFNECGSLYRQRKPDFNMALPPMHWQTYDIDFRAARFDEDGEKTENARISVRHNGVYVHKDVEIVAKTGAGQKEEPTPRPILFQDHRNEVRFRNLWIVSKDNREPRTDVPLGTLSGSTATESHSSYCDDCEGGTSSTRTPLRSRGRCWSFSRRVR